MRFPFPAEAVTPSSGFSSDLYAKSTAPLRCHQGANAETGGRVGDYLLEGSTAAPSGAAASAGEGKRG